MDDCEEGSWRRAFDERGCERRGGDGYGDRNGMTRQRRMSFRAKIEGAVSRLEEETGWTAPRWRYFGCEDEEENFSNSRFKFVEAQGCLEGEEPVHKSQHIFDENAVVQEHDPKPGVEARHC
ncbi:hypothetical protein DL98DRAFT_519856 [Cadophora sp. DSE1049]|nr:hypothetical protein DL98DRAFT_519856 [Cadophora sp. DSE1049]